MLKPKAGSCMHDAHIACAQNQYFWYRSSWVFFNYYGMFYSGFTGLKRDGLTPIPTSYKHYMTMWKQSTPLVWYGTRKSVLLVMVRCVRSAGAIHLPLLCEQGSQPLSALTQHFFLLFHPSLWFVGSHAEGTRQQNETEYEKKLINTCP